jgi:hypothetical protein
VSIVVVLLLLLLERVGQKCNPMVVVAETSVDERSKGGNKCTDQACAKEYTLSLAAAAPTPAVAAAAAVMV